MLEYFDNVGQCLASVDPSVMWIPITGELKMQHSGEAWAIRNDGITLFSRFVSAYSATPYIAHTGTLPVQWVINPSGEGRVRLANDLEYIKLEGMFYRCPSWAIETVRDVARGAACRYCGAALDRNRELSSICPKCCMRVD